MFHEDPEANGYKNFNKLTNDEEEILKILFLWSKILKMRFSQIQIDLISYIFIVTTDIPYNKTNPHTNVTFSIFV